MLRTLPWLAVLVLASPIAAADLDAALPRTDGWIEVRTGHFTLYSNASERRTRKMAVQLERFRQALGVFTRGFELDSQVPTSMFVFKSDAAFRPYRREVDGDEMNVSGYFLPRRYRNYITIDASADTDPFRVVYHEYFHAVMDNSLGTLPTWLNEGLAEFFSTFRVRGGTTVIEVGHPIEEHLRYLAVHGQLPWDEIFRTTPASPTYNEGTRQGAFYAQAWLLTHYFNADLERSKSLSRYLTLLRDGIDEEAAFLEAFGADRATIGKRVDRYRREGGGYVFYDLEERHGDVDVASRELPPSEVLYRLGDLLAQGGPRAAAVNHLEAAREAGAGVGEVETALGVAAYYAGDVAAAEAHLARAVEAGAPSGEAHGRLARIRLERFYRSEESTRYHESPPEPLLDIRRLLERVPKREKDHFETLVILASTYLAGRQDFAPGIAAIRAAKRLRPLDVEMLQIEASLLARDGRIGEALRLVHGDLAPKDADKAEEAEHWVAEGAVMAASWRIGDGEREAAVALLRTAAEGLRAPGLRERVAEMHEVAAEGGQILLSGGTADGTADDDPDLGLFREYNDAIRMANAGDLAGAVERLQSLVEGCDTGQVCETARATLGQIREAAGEQHFVEQFNRAVEAANAGDRGTAVEILRGLHAAEDDPERRERVAEFLKGLGARPRKR